MAVSSDPRVPVLASAVLSKEQEAAYIEAVEAVGRERAAAQGDRFNVDDFLMGATVFLAVTAGMSSMPSSWCFGLMSGSDPITGKRTPPMEDAAREVRRALDSLQNAERQFENGGGESLRGVPTETTFGNARSSLGKVSNLVNANLRKSAKGGS